LEAKTTSFKYSGKSFSPFPASLSTLKLGVNPDGSWSYVSSSGPAGINHNLTQLRNSDFQHYLCPDDVVMMDKAYIGWQGSQCCIPFKRPRIQRGEPRKELSERQLEFNRQHHTIRYTELN